jgi:hypothetical protein
MDDAERLAWAEAVERATCLPSPHPIEVPSDVLIAVDAEFRPGSDAHPVAAGVFGFVIGAVLGFALALAVWALAGGHR